MNAILSKYQKASGINTQEMLIQLARVGEVPTAELILDIAKKEQESIINEVLTLPKLDDDNIKTDLRFRLGEASGLKKLIEAVRAASTIIRDSR